MAHQKFFSSFWQIAKAKTPAKIKLGVIVKTANFGSQVNCKDTIKIEPKINKKNLIFILANEDDASRKTGHIIRAKTKYRVFNTPRLCGGWDIPFLSPELCSGV